MSSTSTTSLNTTEAEMSQTPSDPMQHIRDAKECEQDGYVLEAIEQYELGIQELSAIQHTDEGKQVLYQQYIDSYVIRLNHLRHCVLENILEGELVKHCCIPHDSRGHSYATIFRDYLGNDVREVHIYEPQLNEHAQMRNLVNFLELLAKHCRCLKYVRLFTAMDKKMQCYQVRILQKMADDLSIGKVQFHYSFEPDAESPKIIFSNGFIVKLSRGLHYFQNSQSLYKLGLCDYDFRRCLQTEFEVWQTKPFYEKLKCKAESESDIPSDLYNSLSHK